MEAHSRVNVIEAMRWRHLKSIAAEHVMTRVTHLHLVNRIGISLHILTSYLGRHASYLLGMVVTGIVHVWHVMVRVVLLTRLLICTRGLRVERNHGLPKLLPMVSTGVKTLLLSIHILSLCMLGGALSLRCGLGGALSILSLGINLSGVLCMIASRLILSWNTIVLLLWVRMTGIIKGVRSHMSLILLLYSIILAIQTALISAVTSSLMIVHAPELTHICALVFNSRSGSAKIIKSRVTLFRLRYFLFG